MSIRLLNYILAIALLASVAGILTLRPHPWRPNTEFLPEMVRTHRFNAYSGNPNFADGKTLQSPVDGTIPRGLPPLRLTASTEDAARAGEMLQSPVTSPDAVTRGAKVFSTFCQPCHGAEGRGDGLVVSRGYPAPTSLYAENALKIKDGQLFHIVTYGQKNMPPYAAQISRDDRWNVIAYVRSLQTKSAATGSAATTAATAQPLPQHDMSTMGMPGMSGGK
jgi:mono/diheme cytochrome c family protein